MFSNKPCFALFVTTLCDQITAISTKKNCETGNKLGFEVYQADIDSPDFHPFLWWSHFFLKGISGGPRCTILMHVNEYDL